MYEQLKDYEGVFNRDLEHYIMKFDNFLDKDLCKRGIEQLNEHGEGWQPHEFWEPKTKTWNKLSGDKENDTIYAMDTEVTETIMKDLWYAIDRYIKNYKMPWFSGWSGFSWPRYNKYFNEKQMASHCDHIQSLFTGERRGIPILSCLGTLNEDYEGGDFIMFENMPIEFKTGDLIIFPSVFLYPHKVLPVTKGTRYSYISWVY